MLKNKKEENQEEIEDIGVGQPLLAWEVDEYERHDRGIQWYVVSIIIGTALIIYALATANFMFAVIIIMVGVILFLTGMKHPKRIPVVLIDNGLLIGEVFHPFRMMRDFSVIYDPPEVKVLYIDFHSVWRPLMSIPLKDTDPVVVRECLMPFVVENLNRNEESLTDLVSRLYKL